MNKYRLESTYTCSILFIGDFLNRSKLKEDDFLKKIFLTQPYLLTLQPSSEMNVVWIQREPVEGFVEYGKTEMLGQSILAKCFKITGLRQPLSGNEYAKNPEDNPMMPVWQCIAKIENL